LKQRIEFELLLDPVAKERPRLGKYGNAYTPYETRVFENNVKLLASRYRPEKLLDGPLRLTVMFYVRCPAKPKYSMPAVAPDLSNYMKSLEDGLNGVIWSDDSRICEYGHGTGKFYDKSPGAKPRIVVIVEEL
jgi:Holliday junction resolvase RusA-like endonuclease